MNTIIKRGCMSFAISCFAGTVVNLSTDIILNHAGFARLTSISPEFAALFKTPVIAAYVNILLYGVIGATFAVMTFLYDIEHIGFLTQSLLYFLSTGSVCLLITILLWQLHHYPKALFFTLLGYAATHVIMVTVEYRSLKKDISQINRELNA